MEKIKFCKNIFKWIIALNLIVNNANAELINNIDKTFFQELWEWFNINYFKDWKLESKDTKINLKNKEYFNLDIIKKVLDNNYTLEYFLDKYSYFKHKTKLNNEKEIYIFKSKNLNNKFVYLLYEDKKLKIATLTSPWKWKNQTPLRKFNTQWRYFKKRSKKFNNYPMPFAIHLDGWYFIHRWKVVTWYPASHWCFRLKWLASWINFKNIKYNEEIPVIFTGYDTSF